MVSAKSIFLLSFAGLLNASPAPQNLADIAASLTSELGSLPSLAVGSLSSEFAAATSLVGKFSNIPTLPASVQSVLATAIPASELTKTDYACDATAAPWYTPLPNDVKGALTSYASALQTWAAENLSEFPSYTGINVPVCTGTAANAGTTTRTGSSATTRATGSGTAAGNAASSTNSQGAAPRATGAIMGSVAAAVGVFGVIAAL